MKVCFIGACGHWKQALNTLNGRSDVQICGYAHGSSLEEQSSIDPSVPFYGDYNQMLDAVKPDLAVVSPIFGLTAQVIIACARRGVHVYAEKPVAASLEQLEAVKETVKSSGIRFCAMHDLRFKPAMALGAQLVQQGSIGKLQMITAQKSYKYGTRPWWYTDRQLYGGTIPWVGIHGIDWISYYSNKGFLEVSALQVGKDPKMAVLCQFKLEDGLIASVNIDFYRPDSAPSHGDDRIRCVGTEGILEVRDGKVLLMNREGCHTYEPTESIDLLSAFLDGQQPIDAEEIFHITRAALAAREAADTGKTVWIEG